MSWSREEESWSWNTSSWKNNSSWSNSWWSNSSRSNSSWRDGSADHGWSDIAATTSTETPRAPSTPLGPGSGSETPRIPSTPLGLVPDTPRLSSTPLTETPKISSTPLPGSSMPSRIPSTPRAFGHEPDIPPGWTREYSKSTNSFYYWHAASQTSQFEHPANVQGALVRRYEPHPQQVMDYPRGTEFPGFSITGFKLNPGLNGVYERRSDPEHTLQNHARGPTCSYWSLDAPATAPVFIYWQYYKDHHSICPRYVQHSHEDHWTLVKSLLHAGRGEEGMGLAFFSHTMGEKGTWLEANGDDFVPCNIEFRFCSEVEISEMRARKCTPNPVLAGDGRRSVPLARTPTIPLARTPTVPIARTPPPNSLIARTPVSTNVPRTPRPTTIPGTPRPPSTSASSATRLSLSGSSVTDTLVDSGIAKIEVMMAEVAQKKGVARVIPIKDEPQSTEVKIEHIDRETTWRAQRSRLSMEVIEIEDDVSTETKSELKKREVKLEETANEAKRQKIWSKSDAEQDRLLIERRNAESEKDNERLREELRIQQERNRREEKNRKEEKEREEQRLREELEKKEKKLREEMEERLREQERVDAEKRREQERRREEERAREEKRRQQEEAERQRLAEESRLRIAEAERQRLEKERWLEDERQQVELERRRLEKDKLTLSAFSALQQKSAVSRHAALVGSQASSSAALPGAYTQADEATSDDEAAELEREVNRKANQENRELSPMSPGETDVDKLIRD